MIVSLAMTQLAHSLSSEAIYLGGAGWFEVVPVELAFQGVVVLIGLLYLFGRPIIAAAYPPTLYILLVRHSNQVTSPWFAFSFSPFVQPAINELVEEFFQEDCLRWGKEALWEEEEDGWSIAYNVGTTEIRISPLAFIQACWRQQHATKP